MKKKYIIYGEDPNCDFGGLHVQPVIGYAKGEYDDVLAYAKTLKGWITWGSGGDLIEYKEKVFIEVDESTVEVVRQKKKEEKELRDKLNKEKSRLEKELEKINSQLK